MEVVASLRELLILPASVLFGISARRVVVRSGEDAGHWEVATNWPSTVNELRKLGKKISKNETLLRDDE